jgi:hypothetical protein
MRIHGLCFETGLDLKPNPARPGKEGQDHGIHLLLNKKIHQRLKMREEILHLELNPTPDL